MHIPNLNPVAHIYPASRSTLVKSAVVFKFNVGLAGTVVNCLHSAAVEIIIIENHIRDFEDSASRQQGKPEQADDYHVYNSHG